MTSSLLTYLVIFLLGIVSLLLWRVGSAILSLQEAIKYSRPIADPRLLVALTDMEISLGNLNAHTRNFPKKLARTLHYYYGKKP